MVLFRHDALAARAKTRTLNYIAASQHGMVSRGQALECGYSDSAIARCVAAGLWQRTYRGVYAVAPSARTFEARVMALVLRAPGRTWASHRAAACLWGLDPERGVPEISTTANLRTPRGTVRQVAAMPTRDRKTVRGIPVTSVERTLVDVAAVIPANRLEALVVAALRLRLTSVDALAARVDATDDLGRIGRPRLRKLLYAWTDLSTVESVLEAKLRRILRDHGLPEGVPQLEVFDGNAFVARLDVAYPEQMVAVEADGYRWHGDPVRWRTDLARRNHLTRLGWHVLHFTWHDVEHEPVRVAAEIRRALTLQPAKTSKSPASRAKTTWVARPTRR